MSTDRNDAFFGKLAVKAGFITEKQLKEVFQMQKALALKDQHANIGAIMAAKGLLTRAQVMKIRLHQKKIDANRIAMMCISCGAKYKIKNYRPERKIACQKCGEKLQLSTSKTQNKAVTPASTSSGSPSDEKVETKPTDTIDTVRDILSGMDHKAVQTNPPEQEAVASDEETPELPPAVQRGAETEPVSIEDTQDEPSGIGSKDTADLAKPADSVEDTQDLLARMDDEDSSLNVTIKIDRSDIARQKKTEMNIRPLNVILDDKQNASLDDFSIKHSIGKGGMAEVFAARQASVDRLIALKMIKTD